MKVIKWIVFAAVAVCGFMGEAIEAEAQYRHDRRMSRRHVSEYRMERPRRIHIPSYLRRHPFYERMPFRER